MKPPYRVPSVGEIAALPASGFVAASLFAGCGGSCLGLRMAGFRVGWANEFVAHAQDSYRANMEAGGVLDPRDVRAVQPAEVLAALKMEPGDLDLLNGSPPCRSFSLVGKRERGWGGVKEYPGGTDQRDDDLFAEFARLLSGLMPKVFVAENVPGLARGVAVGFFNDLLGQLRSIGYRVEVKLIDAARLGVPQHRERLIFMGVRGDLGVAPAWPRPLPHRYGIADAIPGIASFTAVERKASPAGIGLHAPLPTVTASESNGYRGNQVEVASGDATERRKLSIRELMRICSFPDDFVLTGNRGQQWAQLGNAVPPLMMKAIGAAIRDGVLGAAVAPLITDGV